MRAIGSAVVGGFGILAMLLAFSVADAKPEFFQKEKANRPDLKCASCHVSIPKNGDEDKKLTETGKFYQKNKSLPTEK